MPNPSRLPDPLLVYPNSVMGQVGIIWPNKPAHAAGNDTDAAVDTSDVDFTDMDTDTDASDTDAAD